MIPAELRRELGIVPGEAVVATVEDDRLVIERRAQILRRLRDELKRSVPEGTGAVDALIAERREEAHREGRADDG